jgi:hypothetical protein
MTIALQKALREVQGQIALKTSVREKLDAEIAQRECEAVERRDHAA